MGDEGVTRGIYEIFEVVMAVAIFLSMGAAILIVSDSDNLQAKATMSEVSYMASLASNYGGQVQLKYTDTQFNVIGNNIFVKYEDSEELSKEYFGEEIKISKSENGNYIMSIIS